MRKMPRISKYGSCITLQRKGCIKLHREENCNKSEISYTWIIVTALLILTSGPLFLIVEYCSHGNLKDFLRNNRPSLLELSGDMEVSLTFRDLLSFAYQITKGMSYLSSKKVIE